MALNTWLSAPSRSAQILGGADALLSDPASMAHAADQILPVSQDGLSAGSVLPAGAAPDVPVPPTPAEGLANSAVLDLHYSAEAASDQNGTSGTVHGVTNLGETVGLGKIGQPNLLTDAVNAPAQTAGGDTSAITHVPADAASIIGAAEGLGAGVTADAVNGSALNNPLGGTAAAAGALAGFPVAALGNEAASALLGSAGTSLGLLAPQTGPAVVDLAHAAELGKLGGDNVLMDVVAAPAALLAGDTTPAMHLPSDLGSAVAAAAPVVEAAGYDIAHSTILNGAASAAASLDGALSPVAASGVAASALVGINSVTNAVISGAETPVQLIAPHTGPAVADLAHAAGLGDLGGPNVLTDIVAVPAALLAGDTTPVMHLPGDLGSAVGAAAPVVAAIGYDIAHSTILNGTASAVAALDGAIAPNAAPGVIVPMLDGINGVTTTVISGVEAPAQLIVPHTAPAVADLAHAAGLGDLGGSNVLTDIVAAPAALLAGDTTPVAHLPGDLGSAVGAATPLVDAMGYDITHSTILNGAASAAASLDGALAQANPSGAATPAVAALDNVTDAAVTGIEVPVQLIAPHTGPAVADLAHAAGLGDLGGQNVLADVLAAPTALAAGDTTPVAHLPGDVGVVADSTGGLTDAAGYDLAHSTILASLASEGMGPGAPLAPVDPAGLVSSLASATGSLGGGAQPSHDAVTITVGPQTATPVATVDILSSSTTASHVVDVHIGSVAAAVPTVSTVAILPDGSFHFPSVANGGGDTFGSALSGLTAASNPAAGTAATHGVDASFAHVDLPVAHADPLAELGHALHHA